MPELRDATVVIGVPGLNGTGITAGEKTALTNDTTALKTATYITQTASATLSAEQALSVLATGLLKVTTGTGVLSTAVAADMPAHTHTLTIGLPIVIDGGGAVITTGTKVRGLEIPFACTITGWTIFAGSSGSIVCTISKATYASHATYTNISGTEKPTLTNQTKNQNLSLTTWTTAVAAGDLLLVTVDSVTGVLLCSLNLRLTRTI